jgi:LysR family transcriptional regulator, benzoate and cis,cis-muconate-responsive activator of ben and cat genes
MELRHLRYFVTIAEEQGFRRAAERLHVSQSPLSRQMQDLEEEMGVQLFEPEGRGIKLTAAGKAFAERARSILASVDAAVDEAQGIAEGRLGTVVIGFETGTTFMGALLSLVAAFRKRAPRLGLQLLPMSSVEQRKSACTTWRTSASSSSHASSIRVCMRTFSPRRTSKAWRCT